MQKLIKTLISNCPEDTIQFAKDLSKTIPFGSTIFMVGAVGMHIKVRDTLSKMLPAITLLMFCFIIFTCPSKW